MSNSTDMPPATPEPILKDRRIIVGVCGGIAAYKACEVVSQLAQRGAQIHVVMTESATKFVTPLTFESLSANKVMTSTWTLSDSADPQHIKLTEKADLILVVPATANLLAKVALGVTDDLLSLMINASACPVVFAPSMNNRMWDHPACVENVAKLKNWGYTFIGPEAGWLACRNVGMGRLSEPKQIIDEVVAMLTDADKMPKALPQP